MRNNSGMDRIIAEQEHTDYWTARLVSNPYRVFFGHTATAAISRLLSAAELDPMELHADYKAARPGHIEYTIGDQRPAANKKTSDDLPRGRR